MITAEEEWTKAFEHIVPTASLAVSVLSVVLAATAVMRPRIARRAYYQDSQYLVSVRYGAWHDIRDFITPVDPSVLAVYSQVGPDTWQLFDLVCREISYRRDTGEFWQLPSETIARRQGDCEDTSILLTSILRNFTGACVALGNYQGYGHAWVTNNGFMYETTYTRARPVPDPENYCAYVLFDDQKVIELWPGALGELFALRRDEATKLNLMSKALGAVT